MRRLNRTLSTIASRTKVFRASSHTHVPPSFLREEGMCGNPKNVYVGGYRHIHKISECEVMKLVRPFLCVVCLLVLSSIHQYLFIICRVHDHLLSLASPLVPDESGSSGGKTPIAAPPPTFASGNLN